MSGNPPLRLSLRVRCPAQRAFEVWTSEIARWWPTEHTVAGERALDIVLEPRVGGRIYERTTGGIELDWGEVTEWEPPSRLAYRWHLREDGADTTEVAITFKERRDSTTRVRIEHRGWERLGALGPGWEVNENAWRRVSAAAYTPIWERASGCAGPYGFVTEAERRLLVEDPLLHLFRNSMANRQDAVTASGRS
ncbi:MAG: SRPBCC domain-containing protein [Actinomycetota bacterium]